MISKKQLYKRKLWRDSVRRYFAKLRKDKKRYAAYRCARNKEAQKWRSKHRPRYRAYANTCNARLKNRTLTHYGKGGKLLCSWRGCNVSDIDCLTLDHVFDNGKQHRASGYEGGINGYRQLEKLGYPMGFQTLCGNHQLKKEIKRRRKK